LVAVIRPIYTLTLHKIDQMRTAYNNTFTAQLQQWVRDERWLCLICLAIGDISFVLNFIDPVGVESIWSQKFQIDTIIVGATFQVDSSFYLIPPLSHCITMLHWVLSCCDRKVLAAAASVRLFIALQASFCHRTRKSVRIFDIITLAFIILELASLGLSANWTTYGVALVQLVASVGHAGFLLIVTLAASLYSATLLKVLLLRAPGEGIYLIIQ
jgi:hypothetical protein